MTDRKAKREKFNSKFGVMMAMAGSAIGLGNMWRFPYLTAKSGGAAFILIYLLMMLFISLPAMITEYLVGRRSRANIFNSFAILGHPRWRFIGLFAVLATIFVLSFYSVVGGWALRYLVQAFQFKFDSTTADYGTEFSSFVSSTFGPLGYTYLFLGLTAFVISGGVKKGIEKFSKIMMSVLFVIIILVVIRSVTLPGAINGLRYLFVPDFGKISIDTFMQALGQAFFSLGLGCGAILVYGSYVKTETNIVNSAIQVAVLDTIFAIIAGIAIIPAIFAIAGMNGYEPDFNAGPGLVFITLPRIFAAMPLGSVIAILFFMSLLLAAITSAISIYEPIVAFIIEQWHKSRTKAVLIGFSICAILATFCSLSQGVMSGVKLFGYNIFDFFDNFSATVLMTGSGLLLTVFAGWVMKKEDFMDELTSHGHFNRHKWLAKTVYILVKYVAPVGIFAIIIGDFLL
ncbi:MAG: sodium-dependent transporter [Bacteroidaceae bacterium]|nr:sodium-dependent transporter [Bacteroidaceae bacterium]